MQKRRCRRKKMNKLHIRINISPFHTLFIILRANSRCQYDSNLGSVSQFDCWHHNNSECVARKRSWTLNSILAGHLQWKNPKKEENTTHKYSLTKYVEKKPNGAKNENVSGCKNGRTSVESVKSASRQFCFFFRMLHVNQASKQMYDTQWTFICVAAIRSVAIEVLD